MDGIVTYTVNAEGHSRTYTQVFRSGVIETVAVFTDDNPSYIYGRYELLLLESVSRCLQEYRRLNISPPVYVGLALVDASGFSFMPGPREYFDPSMPLDRDVLILPEFLVEDFEKPLHIVLRPGFDMVCNAFGLQGSQNYDFQGNFRIPG